MGVSISTGTYTANETVIGNSLVQNSLKFPEVSKILLYKYRQYCLTYLTEALGRITGNEDEATKMVGDNQIKWAIQGRLNEPSEIVGFVGAGRGLNNSAFTLELADNFRNKYDRLRLQSGQNAIVIAEPRASGTGTYLYDIKLETSDPTAVATVSDGQPGALINTMGSAFPKNSKRGYSNSKYPDWFTNWLTIQRKNLTIDGDSFTDVTWLEVGGQRLWYFTQQDQTQKEFIYQMELSRWYGQTTMLPSNVSTVTDDNGDPITTGAGLIAQIDPANTASYSVLTEDFLIDYLTFLATRANFSEDNNWIVFCGMAALKTFSKIMKSYVIDNGNFLFDMRENRYIDVGHNYETFFAVGQKMTLVHNPIFDDPHLWGDQIDPSTGMPYESSRMVFVNFAVQDGKSNIEIFNKGAEGYNRGFNMKYIVGMANPFDPESMFANNSNDGFAFEMLTHSGLIVRDQNCNGMLEKLAA